VLLRVPKSLPWLAILLVPGLAFALSPRVLLPSAAPVIEAAFHRAEPTFTLQDAQIRQDRVLAKVCPPQGVCLDLELRDPTPVCAGQLAGPWCMQWQGPPPQDAAVLERALASDAPQLLWSRPPDAPPPPPPMTWIALGFLVLPVLAGLLAGLLLRRLRSRRFQGVPAGLLLALGPPLVVLPIALLTKRLGLWDAEAMTLLGSLALTLGAHTLGTRRGPLLLAGVTTVLGLAALEVFARLALPTPPAFPPPEEASLVIAPLESRLAEGRLHAQSATATCALLYPQGRDPLDERLPRPAVPGRRVLHIGDSLVFGSGVTPDQRFTTLLERAAPGQQHLNLGLPGTSADAQLLAVRRVLARTPVELAVLYVFVANDFLEMDRPYPCCRDGALLQWPPQGPPQPRCPQADWRSERGMLGWYLSRSPAPLPLRVATAHSWLARHLVALQVRITERLGDGPAPPQERQVDHYRRTVQLLRDELKARGIPLVLVLLPVRTAVAHQGPSGDAEHVVRLAHDLDVPLLNAWAHFTRELGDRPESALFLDQPPGDPHLNPAGHVVLAAWLAQQLPGVTKPQDPR
jgi:hypothetical protein